MTVLEEPAQDQVRQEVVRQLLAQRDDDGA